MNSQSWKLLVPGTAFSVCFARPIGNYVITMLSWTKIDCQSIRHSMVTLCIFTILKMLGIIAMLSDITCNTNLLFSIRVFPKKQKATLLRITLLACFFFGSVNNRGCSQCLWDSRVRQFPSRSILVSLSDIFLPGINFTPSHLRPLASAIVLSGEN